MPRIATDETGKVYGLWTVLGLHGVNANYERLWLCRCRCGSERAVCGSELRKGESGGCFSCRGGATHRMRGAPEYGVWSGMKSRCSNPKDGNYTDYGGRGISVCDRWSLFENFFDDMGPRPSPRHSIDRRDNDGNYEPGNCRWATRKQQSRNRRCTRFLSHHGETLPVTEWAERFGLTGSLICRRLKMGWTTEDSLHKPRRRN